MSASRDRAARVLTGIALLLVATLFFASMDTLSKVAVLGGIPVLMAVWGRYVAQALVTTVFVLQQGGLAVLRPRHPGLQALRGALLLAGSLLLFTALKYMPIGEFTAIMMLAPLVVTLLAGLFFNEHVSPLRWLMVLGGFAGTLVIIRPGGEAFSAAYLLPLAQVAFLAAYQLLTSRMARLEQPLTTHLYTGWVGALLLTPLMPWAWTMLPSLWLWSTMAIMGVLGAIGHFFLIMAYQRAPASTLSPYMYVQIGFAMIGGWIAFDHVPDGWSALGMGMIAACGVVSAWLTVREQRRPL